MLFFFYFEIAIAQGNEIRNAMKRHGGLAVGEEPLSG